MTKLNELIQQLCPDGVAYKKIRDLADYEQPSKYLVKNTDYSDDFTTPVLTAGQTFVLGYTDETDGIYPASKTSPVIIFDDFTAAFKWVDFPFKAKSSAMKIITAKGNVLIRYLYHLMGFLNFSSDEHKRLWLSVYSEFEIPVPPLPVQREIVRILDDFTEQTEQLKASLTAELTARKKQYEYYRDKLLTFGDDVPYRQIKAICDIVDYRGKTPTKTSSGVFLVTAKNIRKGYIDYEKSQEYISASDYDDVMRRGIPKIGDVLITTEAPCGNVAQVDREGIALAQRVIKYRPKSEIINSAYLKYVLLGKEFQSKLNAAATGGTVKGIKGSKLHKLTIPVPSIDAQEKVVSLLESFDVPCNDLTSGLPAEIAARQKQYEYYRDKLLTFKEAKA